MHKKILQFTLAIILAFWLQSCKIDSEAIYHKNATSTMEMNVDLSQMLAFAKMGGSSESDSLSVALSKFPKEWTSLYEIKKKEGEEMPNHPDSIKLMKKTFLKSNFDGDDLVGISMKMDHFTQEEYALFSENNSVESKALGTTNFIGKWDGKNLIINSSELGLDSIKKEFEKEGTDMDDPQQMEEMKMAFQMMDFEYSSKLKFESPIVSVKGQHDWIKKVDDHTIEVTYNFEHLFDEDFKFTHADPQIIVTTK